MRGVSQWYSVFGVWEIEGAEFGVGVIGVWEPGVCAGGEEEALGASWSEGFRGLVHTRGRLRGFGRTFYKRGISSI